MRFSAIPFLLLAVPLFGQSVTLELRSGPVILEALRPGTGPLPSERSEQRAGRIHRYVVFDHTLNAAERVRLETSGVRFLDPLTPQAWTVSMPAEIDRDLLRTAGLMAWHAPTPADKLDPALRTALTGKGWRGRSVAVTVVPWPDLGGRSLDRSPVLEHLPHEEQGSEGSRIVQLTGRALRKLLDSPAVQWVAPAPVTGEPEDIRGRTFHRVNPIAPAPGAPGGLDGSGVAVVVNDDGFAGPHIDFKGRTSQSSVAQDLVGDHGDMVAGIVGAAGNLDPRNVGMAPGAEIIVRQYQGSLPNTVTLHQNNGAVIFNSSYSDGCNGGYTTVTRQVDQETVANPALIQVFSAGNTGGQDCGYGAGSDWGNITGGHKIAKNCITSANLTDNDLVVNSSSRGPSADGRLKPDISAYGNGQISNAPDNTYMTGSGTSAASPGVAGSLAVLYQGWRERFGNDPSSGLLKALVLNTADDLGNDGPDYTYGWGRLNTSRAWQAIVEERFITGAADQGQQQVHTIEVPAGVGELRVMLYWMDPAASLQAPEALVNDLDLLGTDPQTVTHQPWELDNTPVAGILAAPAQRGADHVNNVEQVAVPSPVPGTWSFTVTGGNVPAGPQPYYLVHEFLPEGPRITYPLAGDVVAADESHRFRWDALEGTASFEVSLSLDSGITWSSYPQVPAVRRHFDLGLGNVVVENALFRVERNGTTDISGPFTIMPVADGLQVTFNCIDSAGISWSAVPQASGYILHKLGAQYMDSVGLTVGTTYTFTGLQASHDDWFAVTAIAPNGARARRSLALPRPQQLVNCQAERDLAAVALVEPGALVLQCHPAPPISIMVRNEGLLPVQDFTVGHQVNNGPVTTQSLSQLIAPGDSVLVDLTTPMNGLTDDDSSIVRVWATALNESFPPNDTLTTDVYSTMDATSLPFLEHGEGLDLCSSSALCDLACADVGTLFNGRNGIDDDIDWRVDAAGTPTASTGPATDHTLGTESGRYFYLESSGYCNARRADLHTPCLTLPAQGAYALAFWYHLYGATQGELHVDLFVDGALLPDIVPMISGDQGDQWRQGTVDLSGYTGSIVSVRFRGITGNSPYSDMALDDIGVEPATAIDEPAGTEPLDLRPTAEDGSYVLVLDRPAGAGSELRVFDPAGRSVRTLAAGQRTQVPIDLTMAASGAYIVRLEADGVVRQGLLVRP